MKIIRLRNKDKKVFDCVDMSHYRHTIESLGGSSEVEKYCKKSGEWTPVSEASSWGEDWEKYSFEANMQKILKVRSIDGVEFVCESCDDFLDLLRSRKEDLCTVYSTKIGLFVYMNGERTIRDLWNEYSYFVG